MSGSNHLLRVLGVVFGLAAVVGSIIGQGILRSPGVVAEATESGAVIIGLWIAGALISCLNAFSYAELGAAIPRAGGEYAFIDRAFGTKASLLAALAILVSGFGTLAYLCFVVGEFLVRLGVGGGELSEVSLGLMTLAVATAINASGTKISGASQVLFSSLKGLVLMALVIALFASPGAPPPVDPEPLRNGWLPMGTAIVVVITTFGGWWHIAAYGEEIENPGRAIPRALFGGLFGVAVIYVLINLAMLHVMTPDQMAGSSLVAADAAGIVFGEKAQFLLTCFGVLSVGAIANLGVMSFARQTYAIAREGVLPRWLAVVGKHGTPIRAVLLNVAVAAVLMLTGSYLALVSLGETVFLPVMIGVAASVIVLRRKEPELERPYRVPFYPYTIYASILVLSALTVVFVAQDPFYGLAGFVLVGAMWLAFQLAARLRGQAAIAEAHEEDL